jgi:mono/diheme cytochrome c family protein
VKVLKIIGWCLGGLVVILLLGMTFAVISANSRLNQTYTVEIPPIQVPSDPESIAEGERIFRARNCSACHDLDLSGRDLDEAAVLGVVAASNLTSGEGGAASQYTSDEDFVRAIRHGVGPDGKPLVVMPSEEFSVYSEHDIALLIAYIKSVPPVDEIHPEARLSPLGALLMVSGVAPLLSAEVIDHNSLAYSELVPEVSVEYGEYLARSCTTCHGSSFAGGPIPVGPPDWPPAANLTPDAETGLGNWTEEDFFRAIREGTRPDGSKLYSEAMPWETFRYMSDTELSALWLFLSSLEPVSSPEADTN